MVWLHVLAAITWIGGMIFISLILGPALRKFPADSRGELLRTVGAATRAVGWIAVLILLFTGLLNVLHLQIQWNSFLGRLLTVKLTLAVVMIVLSVLHDFILGPRLSARLQTSAAEDPSVLRLRNRVSYLARINLLLALAVVYLAVLIARA